MNLTVFGWCKFRPIKRSDPIFQYFPNYQSKYSFQLNIPSTKESKEDSWKFGGSSKSTSFNRVDSCLDSGRGSSIGYSSDTFSPLSSASAGSRGSPQSVQESDTRKIWDSKIWGAPTETTKLVWTPFRFWFPL